MTAILLIFSFLIGLCIGLYVHAALTKIFIAVDALRDTTNSHTKKTGVVRPGIGSMPIADTPNNVSKSGVVRPRPPIPDDNGTNEALSAVRNRTSNV